MKLTFQILNAKKVLPIMVILFSLMFENKINAQNHNKWYFGSGAGLDFSTYPPKGISSNFPPFCQAPASICNDSGELIFYTDGQNVYDKNGIIPNGQGLMGDSIFSTTTLIVATPKTNNQWYVFYSKTRDYSEVNYYYSKITLNDYQLILTEKNTPLLSGKSQLNLSGKICNYYLKPLQVEKIFFCCRDTLACLTLDSSGLDTNKIIFSGLKLNYHNIPSGYKTGAIGQMTISNSGKWLSLGRARDIYYYGPALDTDSAILYQLDILNGKIINYTNIQKFVLSECTRNPLRSLGYTPYLYQFSPNDSFLYLSYLVTRGGTPGVAPIGRLDSWLVNSFNENAYLTQLDLYALNTDSALRIINSNMGPDCKLIPGCDLGPGMALGPDGKLYISGGRDVIPGNNNYEYAKRFKGHHMSVIEYPDKKYPACNFKCWALDVPGEPWFVLPQYQYMPERINFGYLNANCYDSLTVFSKSDSLYTAFKWFYNNNKDSVVGDTVKLPITKSGYLKFTLQAIAANGFKRTKIDSVLVFTKPKTKIGLLDSIGCQYISYQFLDSSTTDTLKYIYKNGQWRAAEKWLWSFGDTQLDSIKNPKHTYLKNAIYPVLLKYSNGFCADSVILLNKVNILATPKPGFSLNDTIGCIPFLLKITDKSIGLVKAYTYLMDEVIFDSTSNPTITLNTSGIRKIKQLLLGPTGCVTKDSALITIHNGIGANFTPTFALVSVNAGDSSTISIWPKVQNALKYTVNIKNINTNLGQTAITNDTFYLHAPINAGNETFEYRINVIDSCQNPSLWSKPHSPILLFGENINNEKAKLNWSTYKGWSPSYYEIYSFIPTVQTNSFVANSNTNIFEDKNFNENIGFSKCYFVKAIENTNGYTSFSNTNCIPYKSVFFMPNAFTPNADGLNDKFTPVVTFVKDYTFKIYNKWGGEIFQTNNPGIGWDGKYLNESQAGDVYFYIITYTDEKSIEQAQKGTLTLIR